MIKLLGYVKEKLYVPLEQIICSQEVLANVDEHFRVILRVPPVEIALKEDETFHVREIDLGK